MELQAINLIIFGIGIILSTIIVRVELCGLVDSIQSEHDTKFERIKRHLTSAVFWFGILIFDIVMFSLWLVSGNFGG